MVTENDAEDKPNRRQFALGSLFDFTAVAASGIGAVRAVNNYAARKHVGEISSEILHRGESLATFEVMGNEGYVPASITVDNRNIYVLTQDNARAKYRLPPGRIDYLNIVCPTGIEIIFRDCTLPSVSIYPKGDGKKTTIIRYTGKTSTNIFCIEDNIKIIGKPVPVSDKGVAR